MVKIMACILSCKQILYGKDNGLHVNKYYRVKIMACILSCKQILYGKDNGLHLIV